MGALVRGSLLLVLLHLSAPSSGDSASLHLSRVWGTKLGGWGSSSGGAGTLLRRAGGDDGLRGGEDDAISDMEEDVDEEWDKIQERQMIEKFMREGHSVEDAVLEARRAIAIAKGKKVEDIQRRNETVYHLLAEEKNMTYDETLLKFGVSQEYLDKEQKEDTLGLLKASLFSRHTLVVSGLPFLWAECAHQQSVW